jgi:methionyl-tRNA formyltransferase
MKITVLITSKNHPINQYLNEWAKENNNLINILHSKEGLVGGDILFLISCIDILPRTERGKFKKTLVIHASDLPNGRGWSPHVWEIINGATEITLSLLVAEDEVDTGDIWKKIRVNIPKTAIYNEINQLIFDAEIELMNFAISHFKNIEPIKQSDIDCSYWPKRSPKDSEIDINRSIVEQFDLIRVCDPDRYPAFFYKDGKRFDLVIRSSNGYID